MISIRVDDEFLDLLPDTKISVTLNNPLFNEDNLSPGSFSLPFNLPLSPKNNRLLSIPSVIESLSIKKKIDAQLLVSDVPLHTGQLVLGEVAGRKISVNFIFGMSVVKSDLKTKKIRSLLNEVLTVGVSPIEKCVYIKPGDGITAPFKITINGEQYEGSSLPDLRDNINSVTLFKFIKAEYVTVGDTGGMTPQYLKIYATVEGGYPSTDLFATLHVDVSEDNGTGADPSYRWNVESFDMTDYLDEFRDFIELYFTATPPNDKVRFPILFNDGSQDPYIKLGNFVNAQDAGGLVVNGFGEIPFVTENRNSLQPFLKISYLLELIEDYLGVTLDGDWLAHTNDMLIWNTAMLDVPTPYIGKTPFIFWKRSFNLQELVPDMTIVEFFLALQSRYNLGIYLERNNVIRFVKREVIAKSNVFSNLPVHGRAIKTPDLRVSGIKLIAAKDDTDSYSTVDELSVGEPEVEKVCKMMGVGSNLTFSVNGTVITAPRVKQKQGEKMLLKIFYDEGYTVGTTYNYNKCSVDAVYSERFDGVNGLYETFWKYWLHFEIRRRAVQLPVFFQVKHMNYFDWRVKRIFDRKAFLIKSIEIDADANGLAVSITEIYSML